MKLPLYRRLARVILPTGRVPWPWLDPKIRKMRLEERCDRLPVFIQHRIYLLVVQNCHMILEAEAGGAYRAVLKHFWHVLKHDIESCRWAYSERFTYFSLRLRGWDKASIAIKYEADYEAEFPNEETVDL